MGKKQIKGKNLVIEYGILNDWIPDSWGNLKKDNYRIHIKKNVLRYESKGLDRWNKIKSLKLNGIQIQDLGFMI